MHYINGILFKNLWYCDLISLQCLREERDRIFAEQRAKEEAERKEREERERVEREREERERLRAIQAAENKKRAQEWAAGASKGLLEETENSKGKSSISYVVPVVHLHVYSELSYTGKIY